MASVKISNLPSLAAIDRAADVLPIVDTSLATTSKATPNFILGITGDPLGTTDIQTVSNKTLGNSNTFTIRDDRFTLQDNADTTKQAVLQLSGITTATTRTYTLPNASTTLVGNDNVQTLTNKTLTSPSITGGTISNSTITVDSIAGFSTSTIVTVGGVQMNNGTIGTASAVTASSIATGAVTPVKLMSGTGSGWSMNTWSPTWTNLTVGNGTVTARYIQIGKLVFCRLALLFGSTSAITGGVLYTLPVTSVTYPFFAAAVDVTGMGDILDNGGATPHFTAQAKIVSTTQGKITYLDAGANSQELSTTAPMTWTTGDYFNLEFWYEAV